MNNLYISRNNFICCIQRAHSLEILAYEVNYALEVYYLVGNERRMQEVEFRGEKDLILEVVSGI
jgi:hypothetical protein